MKSLLINWRWWVIVFTTATLILAILPLRAEAGETDTFRFQPYPLEVQGQERRTFTVNLEPGDAATDQVQLTNKSNEARRFRVYAADAHVDGEGRATVADATAETRGVGSWIDIEGGKDEFGLLPQTSEVVRFSVTRPLGQNAEGTGAIVAEEIRMDDPSGGIDVAYRLAILVRMTGDPTGLELVSPEVDLPLQIVPSEGEASVDVVNHTAQAVDATVEMTVESLTGYEWHLEPVEVSIEPGASVPVVQEWTTVPRWGGVLRVRADATWEAGTVSSMGPRNAYPPLWFLAIAIALVGIRGLREMWSRHKERRSRREPAPPPAPDPDALRGRLIEAALWLHAAGRDAPRELRETTAAEAQAVAAEARRTKDASDIEHAARSLAAFANGLDGGDGSTQKAAHDFDEWFREHRDDPHVKELVGA